MIRKATLADLDALMPVYAAARRYMAENGNPTQWGTTTPRRELLESDVEKGQLYVVEAEGSIHGGFVLQWGEDPFYTVPVSGSWRYDDPYGTIHRIASDGTRHGVFAECLAYCEAQTDSLRIDTHADNHTMQHLIQKHGVTYSATVRMADGTLRFAYERRIAQREKE